MTRTEKLNIALSVIALVLSTASPFITYRLLDPSLQAYRMRGRLQVSGDPRWGKSKDVSDMPDSYELEIVNVGYLPAEDIQIIAESNNASEQSANFDPPVKTETTTQGNSNFITVKTPLAPRARLLVDFPAIPKLVNVTSNSGDRTILYTGVTWYPGAKEIKTK
jgi:hypothetical protein